MQWRPGALTEGPAKRDRAAEGMPDRQCIMKGAHIPLRSRIFLRKKLLLPSRSCPILPQPVRDKGFAGDLLCQAPSKGRPQSVA